MPIPKGSVREALPEGAFSEVALASRFLLAYRDAVNPLGPASIIEGSVSPSPTVRGYRRSSGLSTRGLPISETVQGLNASRNPSPNYEPGM